MGLGLGNISDKNIFLGSSQVKRIYEGTDKVYQGFSPASEQEFIEQTAAGGPAQLLKVYGKSIVWNHGGGVRNTGPEIYGITRTKISYNLIRVSGTSTQQTNFTLSATFSTIAGHIYIAILSEVPQGCTPSSTRFTGNGSNTNFGLIIPVGVSVNAEISCHWFDLTLMYGAGNEPASIAAFLVDHPDALTASYDPGSLQSNKTAELRAYDGGNLRGSLALNLSTLTGKLNGEGASVVVYPDGLRGVGTDRDAAYGNTGEVARAVVDLGTLNWSYHAASSSYPYGYFSASLADYTKTDDTFLLTAKYSFVRGGWTVDKTIRGGDNGSHSVYIIDSAYTDAATFKTAMSGIMLDYPLATPLTYTLDTPLPTDLTCEQGDILQRVSDNNCPFVGEMKFGL